MADIYSSEDHKIYKRTFRQKMMLFSFLMFLLCVGAFVLVDKFIDPSFSIEQQLFNIIVPLGFASLTVSIYFSASKLIKILIGIPATLILFLYLAYLFLITPHKISGRSMEPSLKNQSYVIGDKLRYRFIAPKRGDIVIFISRRDGESVARVVGLPGERFSITNDKIYIDSKPLDEPYLNRNVKTKVGSLLPEGNIEIPPNKYVLLGDNREHSFDSRDLGFIEKSSIKERMHYIYWPQEDVGFIKY